MIQSDQQRMMRRPGTARSDPPPVWGSGQYVTATVPDTLTYRYVHGLGYAPKLEAFHPWAAMSWWVESVTRTEIIFGFASGAANKRFSFGLSQPAVRADMRSALTPERLPSIRPDSDIQEEAV